MIRRIKHYISSVRKPDLHIAICRCEGYGFRYHILGIGREKK